MLFSLENRTRPSWFISSLSHLVCAPATFDNQRFSLFGMLVTPLMQRQPCFRFGLVLFFSLKFILRTLFSLVLIYRRKETHFLIHCRGWEGAGPSLSQVLFWTIQRLRKVSPIWFIVASCLVYSCLFIIYLVALFIGYFITFVSNWELDVGRFAEPCKFVSSLCLFILCIWYVQ